MLDRNIKKNMPAGDQSYGEDHDRSNTITKCNLNYRESFFPPETEASPNLSAILEAGRERWALEKGAQKHT